MNTKKILLIDDEPAYTEMLGMSLEQFGGYRVHTVNAVSEVLAAAAMFQPDLILLDVMMPELDGGDVGALLAARPSTRDIPVVFLSALVETADTAQSARSRAPRRYLSKSLTVRELIANIEDLFSLDASPA